MTSGARSAERLRRAPTGGRRYHIILKYQLYHSTSSAENKVIAKSHIVSEMLKVGCGMNHGTQVRVCHLQTYQTRGAQISSLSQTTAAVKVSFQSHLSHFSLLSSGANPNPHPVLTLKGDCSLMEERERKQREGAGGREVMSSLPLRGISLIKMK